MLDRPVSGRIFFEQVIRENLDGRPKQVQLIFERWVTRRSPGTFRTRVITDGVILPCIDYKGTRIKQYHKQGALRTETTINNARDFYVGKRLCNLYKLRQIGFQANRRLLEAEKISHDCILTEEQFHRLHHSLQVGQQRVSALSSVIATSRLSGMPWYSSTCCLPVSPTVSFAYDWAPLLGLDPQQLTPGKMTYHLRRLRLHGLIERIPHTHRYRQTTFGIRVALFFTLVYDYLLRPDLGAILPTLSRPGFTTPRFRPKRSGG